MALEADTRMRAREADALEAALLDLIADRVVDCLRPLVTPAESDPRRLLDLEEAAARLGRSTRWVRERVKRGDLP